MRQGQDSAPISEDMAGKSSVDLHCKRRRCDDNSDDDDADEGILEVSDKLLDCPICYHTLTIPVYQCVAGHVICSSCRSRLERKECPFCSVSLRPKIRTRAIENILKSARVACSNKASGCAARLTLSTKLSHEQTCVYAPYNCLIEGCSFSGSPTKLYLHLKNQHASCLILNSDVNCFRYDLRLRVSDSGGLCLLLDRANQGPIFIFDKGTMGISSIIEPSLGKDVRFRYKLGVRHKRGFYNSEQLEIRPWRKTVAAATSSTGSAQSENLRQLLNPLFEDGERVKLDIRIYCNHIALSGNL